MTWRWKHSPYVEQVRRAERDLHYELFAPEQRQSRDRSERLLRAAEECGLPSVPDDLAELVIALHDQLRRRRKRKATDPRVNKYEKLVVDFANERDRYKCVAKVNCAGCCEQNLKCPRRNDAVLKRLLKTDEWQQYGLTRLRAMLTEACKIPPLYEIVEVGSPVDYWLLVRSRFHSD